MRFCTNCGERLADEQVFCPNCGTPVKGASPAKQPVVSFETKGTDAAPKKKKKRGWWIALICVAAVLLLAVLLLGYLLLGWFRAPHQRLQGYTDKGAKLLSAVVLSKEADEAFSTDSTLSLDAADVTLPEQADAAVYYLFGMDTATLLNAVTLDLNVDADMEEQEMLLQAALNLSGSAIMEYTFTADDDGVGAYVPSLGTYAVTTWEMLNIPSPLDERVKKEDVAALILDLADAFDLILTKDSVTLERGYDLDCGDDQTVKCKCYSICPDKNEWEDFLLEIADALEDSDAAQMLFQTASASSGADTSNLPDQLRSNAKSIAETLSDNDVTLEWYEKGVLPVGAAFTMDGETSVSAVFTSHSGYRGLSVRAEQGADELLLLELNNSYESGKDGEDGSVDGFIKSSDNNSADVAGQYQGASFELSVTVNSNGNIYPAILKNECSDNGNTKGGTLSFRLDAPKEDGCFAVSLDYDFAKDETSVLRVPYGTYALSLELRNLTYTYDEMLSNARVLLTVEQNRSGGSDHILTVRGLAFDDSVRIDDASVILSTTDEPSTAEKPSVAPQVGDLDLLQSVITGGIPTNLW